MESKKHLAPACWKAAKIILLSIGILGGSALYIIVFTLYDVTLVAPDNAVLTKKPQIVVTGLSKSLSSAHLSDEWLLTLNSPRPWLQGVDEFFVTNELDGIGQDTATVSFVLNEDNTPPIQLRRIYLRIDGEGYSSDKWADVRWCKEGNEDRIDSLLADSGHIAMKTTIKRVHQGLKRFVVKATFHDLQANLYPSPYVVCSGGIPVKSQRQPLEVSINLLAIDADSTVVYEASSKGGTVYRL